MAIEKCGNCHFLMGTSDSAGYCRRFPPVSLAMPQKDSYGNVYHKVEYHMPFMDKSEWCGEFKDRDPTSQRM